mmetsp:Transcript_26370/g.60887  ORF Transcript_26370/g.60887 Transcript_26370/m.60887 type:complete len:301 (+) Transcript_26370:39-941(+)
MISTMRPVLIAMLAASSLPGAAAFLPATPSLASSTRPAAAATAHPAGALALRCSEKRMERRAFGGLFAAGIGALAVPARGAWAGESAMRKLMPSEAELVSYEAAAGGVLFKDVAPGVGTAVKAGDKLRMLLTMFLSDGTMVTRTEGIEVKVALGSKDLPAGLLDGLVGMKVGGQRIVKFPAEVGFTSEYRAAAVAVVKGCGNGVCKLDAEPVVAMVKLAGYEKKECQGSKDSISADASQFFTKGEVRVTIGNEACPEGNTEITEARIKMRSMVENLKASGKIDTSRQEGFAGVVPKMNKQ